MYFILKGDVEVETNNGTVLCKDEPDHPDCPSENALVIVLFAVYMMMINVLLLNVLIAMFRYLHFISLQNS